MYSRRFKAMVPAILILTFAWTLKAMTDSLGAAEYVAGVMETAATGLVNFLPAIIFLVGCFLAFATGTSWGTFGILIPIVVAVFQGTNETMMIISISACMAGAVCGDHCSPISDTTIMASAGAQCNHVNHVSTQLPYAMTVAAVSFVTLCHCRICTERMDLSADWYYTDDRNTFLWFVQLQEKKNKRTKRTFALRNGSGFRIFLKSRCSFLVFSFGNSDDLQIHFTSGIYPMCRKTPWLSYGGYKTLPLNLRK